METNCRVSLTTLKGPVDPGMDALFRACAVAKKVGARFKGGFWLRGGGAGLAHSVVYGLHEAGSPRSE